MQMLPQTGPFSANLLILHLLRSPIALNAPPVSQLSIDQDYGTADDFAFQLLRACETANSEIERVWKYEIADEQYKQQAKGTGRSKMRMTDRYLKLQIAEKSDSDVYG